MPFFISNLTKDIPKQLLLVYQILWGLARGSGEGGGEAGGSAGPPVRAGGGGGREAPVGEAGHAAAARQCCHLGKPCANFPCPGH